MEKLTRFALTNARFTQVFIIMLFIIGISTFLKSPSKEDPEIMIRNAIVVAQFPGMSPDRIEKLITKPLEREIKQIPEVSEIKSWVRTGVTQINVSVHDKYFELQPIWDTLRNRMEEVQNKLPEGTYGPYVNDEFGRVYSATIALTGDDFTPRERRRMAEFLQDKMSTYSTISQVALYGVQEERIWLTPKDDTIAENKFSVKQIKTSVQARNVVLPGGTIDAGALEVVIEPSGNFESVEEIQNMVLFERDSGQSVYLRDLIDLSRGYEDPFKTPVFFNNQSAIVIAASMADGTRSDDFGADIESFLTEYQKQLPAGMALELATFQPEKVTASVSSATSNLMQTVVVVLAVVMLFLGVRMGLIVGSIVPLTILLTIIGMSVWGRRTAANVHCCHYYRSGFIEYKVVGDDENVLRVIASQIENALHHIPGTVGIDNNWENSVPKITIDIDQTAAQRAGITSRDIAISLNSFLEGYEVTSYREDDDVIPVMIRGNDERNEIGKLFSMRIISSSSGEPLPLLQFADFSTTRESAVIRREDLQRVMTVSVKHANLQASELNKLVQPYLENLKLPDGYSIELGGELKGASKANGALFGYLPHCFAVMVLLLLLQFNSVRRPAIILLTIPLSLIGAVSGLLIMDAYFTSQQCLVFSVSRGSLLIMALY